MPPTDLTSAAPPKDPTVEQHPNPRPPIDPISPVSLPSKSHRGRRLGFWVAMASSILLAVWWSGHEVWSYRHERSAQQAFDEEDYDGALRHIALALRVRSDRVSTNFLAARIERARRVYPEAEKYLLRCKELGGMTPSLQMEWLLLRCEKGYVDELAPELLAAVNQNHPESAAILEAMALVYMRQTRYPAALAVLDQWVERVPNSTRALDWRGWVSNQMDHRGQAIDDYTRVLELQPGRSTVRLRLVELLIESSRHAEALSHLEQLHIAQPTNPDVMTGLAACRIVQLRRDEAHKLLEEVLAAHPDHFAAILLLGNLEREDRRYGEAERRLRRAIELKPLDPTARYSLYLTLQAQPDRQKDAEDERVRWEQDRDATARVTVLLRGRLTERPNDPNLAAEAGELLFRQGENQLGLFWLNKALQLDPNHTRSHKALAEYYERMNDPVQAELHRRQLVGSRVEK
jgi:tetratricopeptide (TPR) repeat protein